MTQVWMTRGRWVLVMAVALAGYVVVGRGEIAAQPKIYSSPAEGERDADRKAIQEVRARLITALEKRDVKSLLDCFTSEGEYVASPGEPIQGRAALEKLFGAHFAATSGEQTIQAETTDLRFIARDSAMERGQFSIKTEAAQDPTSSRYSALFVREGGQWKVAMLRERLDTTVSLESLEWIVGSWQVTTEDKSVTTTYEWALDKKFLKSQFSVTENGKTRSGWQMIAADPAKTSLRAWTFDSNGGYGEAEWKRDGDHWVVSSHVTLADGGETRATNIVTRIDANTFSWQSTHRFLNDQPLEDLPPVRIARAPVTQVTKENTESAK